MPDATMTGHVVEKIDNKTLDFLDEVYAHQFHCWWVSMPGLRGRVAMWAIGSMGIYVTGQPREYAISCNLDDIGSGSLRAINFFDAVVTAIAVLQYHNGSGDMPT